MLRNYLATALNNLLKNKLFAAINLVGLAIGLAGTILIGLFVIDELSYDDHYPDAERIYRISRDFHSQNLQLATNAPQVAALLKQDFPEIEQAARIFGGQVLLSREEVAFYEDDVRFADNEFFDIFAFEWLAGSPAQALTRPNTVVLTESLARKYFGAQPALGQSVTIERAIPLEVTGVIRDLPHNTHLDLGPIVSMPTVYPIVGEEYFRDWANNSFYTYVRLRPGAAIETLEQRFVAFMDRHFQENSAASTGISAMALRDIHLRSTRQNEMQPPGSMDNVWLFSAIAVFILLIACLNFMNLSTARSTRRGKEVGVRKALGASRSQVAWQFVGESLLLTLLASMLAVALVELALPPFNAFIGKELSLEFFSDLRVPALLAALIACVGIVAGSYPAFFLSGFKPTQVLRSVLAGGGSVALRNTLVTLQFAIAIVLVVATVVVLQQLDYARGFEQGFQREQVVIVKGPPTAGLGPNWPALREELLRHPEILDVTASAQLPLEVNTNSVFMREEGAELTEGRPMPFMFVDFGFFATYAIPVLAGRTFSEDFPADRLVEDRSGERTFGHGFVLNRTGAAQMGWEPEEALGKALSVYVSGGPHSGTVVGVVEDSNFESVRSAVKPIVFLLPPPVVDNVASMQNASIHLSGRDLEGALAHIDAVWKQFMPEFPMVRHFLEEDFDALYRPEDRQGDLFYAFALLAIFIACMGLYGLASFNAERRTKEIGVRKVMGGSVMSIVMLLTNDFSKLVLLSNLVAWPVAWIAMERWLSNFAYRIDLAPLVFVGSGAIALCIAWVTVGGTAAKAASAKPVLALRYE